jgi:hypothetical protein
LVAFARDEKIFRPAKILNARESAGSAPEMANRPRPHLRKSSERSGEKTAKPAALLWQKNAGNVSVSLGFMFVFQCPNTSTDLFRGCHLVSILSMPCRLFRNSTMLARIPSDIAPLACPCATGPATRSAQPSAIRLSPQRISAVAPLARAIFIPAAMINISAALELIGPKSTRCVSP